MPRTHNIGGASRVCQGEGKGGRRTCSAQHAQQAQQAADGSSARKHLARTHPYQPGAGMATPPTKHHWGGKERRHTHTRHTEREARVRAPRHSWHATTSLPPPRAHHHRGGVGGGTWSRVRPPLSGITRNASTSHASAPTHAPAPGHSLRHQPPIHPPPPPQQQQHRCGRERGNGACACACVCACACACACACGTDGARVEREAQAHHHLEPAKQHCSRHRHQEAKGGENHHHHHQQQNRSTRPWRRWLVVRCGVVGKEMWGAMYRGVGRREPTRRPRRPHSPQSAPRGWPTRWRAGPPCPPPRLPTSPPHHHHQQQQHRAWAAQAPPPTQQ
jgi:hypothetical protein